MDLINEMDFLETLDGLLIQNLDEHDFGIAQVCQALHLSRTSLHRRITECTGMSISIYIRTFRLNKALDLLQTTPQSISNITYEVGFSDLAYFSRCFKEQFGVPPSDIRLNN